MLKNQRPFLSSSCLVTVVFLNQSLFWLHLLALSASWMLLHFTLNNSWFSLLFVRLCIYLVSLRAGAAPLCALTVSFCVSLVDLLALIFFDNTASGDITSLKQLASERRFQFVIYPVLISGFIVAALHLPFNEISFLSSLVRAMFLRLIFNGYANSI